MGHPRTELPAHRAGSRALCVAALVLSLAGGACSPGRPSPEAPPGVPSAPAPHTPDVRGAGTGPGAAALRRVIEAERTVAFTGYERTVHGVPGRHRETAFRVRRLPGGRTLLDLEPRAPTGAAPGAGADVAAPSAAGWSYEGRHAWMEDPSLLLSNYTVAVDDEAPQVAWRPTRRLHIAGRLPGRPSLELLVDQETWVILREEFRDAAGEVRLTSTFESIAFEDPGLGRGDYVGLGEDQAEATEAIGFEPLAAAVIPAGFVLARRRDSAGELVQHYSDGLSAFLIRQRRASPGAVPGEVEHTVRQGRETFSATFAGVNVEVTGYLGTDELETVVRGLRGPAR